jgi:8-oxo-dGTP diphosphatase
MDETLDECARRELMEETGVEAPVLFHFANYSEPDRDPRERVVSAAYLALMPFDAMAPQADSDASEVTWVELGNLPSLAFDHADIVEGALLALRARCEGFEILFGLLPRLFTLGALLAAYEAIMGCPTDRRNFHKAVLASGLIEATGETFRGRHRPARQYRATAP